MIHISSEVHLNKKFPKGIWWSSCQFSDWLLEKKRHKKNRGNASKSRKNLYKQQESAKSQIHVFYLTFLKYVFGVKPNK